MSVHLVMSAGRGPRECAWALARLLHRLEAEAVRRRLATRRIETVPGHGPGTWRSVLVEISGAGAEEFASGWTGTLCWQSPSPYRAGTGRKNWYVSAQPCRVETQRTRFLETDVDIVACRTGGPGGQHRDKASTAVRATHRPTGTVIVVDAERQFSLNRRIALRLLRERLDQTDEAATRTAANGRWHLHDQLVRGNPIRIERP
ncbi:peptide chain release factor [Micromonospora phaseoli]|uniref:Peptide chain release factor n=1 Tax=Micromonospora phaseoli TaxID=1144548 RepID=A0A1H6UXZ2_9ACTN|nr:peptide chain release factor H [Micromonospora phaseoli]PZV99147.1 peptide chain release factor [Micromonospora phaseoli]GIJ78651.1 peptide chain release factor H [Micromonospora phaseoli]SEI95524.1 peptide chain release factor [Micromonospora phaseoli]